MKRYFWLFVSVLLVACTTSPETADDDLSPVGVAGTKDAGKDTTRPVRPMSLPDKARAGNGKPALLLPQVQTPAAKSEDFLSYTERVSRRIQRKARLPADLPKGLAVAFLVVQSREGQVLSIKLKSSSGYRPYDVAMERAIRESAPLPKPLNEQDFREEMVLSFRS